MCLTVLSQSRAWSAILRKTVDTVVGYQPSGSLGLPRLGMWEVFQYFGLRQDAVVLSSSRQTELKAHLSSKSLTLFLLNEGGGNWTRTV